VESITMVLNAITTIYSITVRTATPILLVALGGMFTYHAGIINVAMEALLLISAFFAVVFSYLAGNALIGVLVGIVAGTLISFLYSFFVSTLKANNFAIGFALNIFVSALTLYLMRILFKGKNVFNSPDIRPIGVLSLHTGIFVLDDFLFNFSILTYVAIILFFLSSYLVYQTSFGLRLRVSGENPGAIEVAGLKNNLIQYSASIMCGICCGLAGAQLSLHNVRMFTRDMSNGRGFIALAIILIAKGRPLTILLISLLFGLFDALTFQLQGANIPPQFALMLPYIMSVIILFIFYARDVKRKRD
jgi:simple sugar transport system permease protein